MDRRYLKQQLMDFFNQYQLGINWRLLTLNFEVHSLHKGECLVHQGEHSSKVFFLNKGLLRYYSLSDNGKEYTQTLAKAPRMVGSTRAMVSEQPSLFSIEALEPCLAISFSWKSFYQQMSQDLAFMQAYAKFMESIFISKEMKEHRMASHSATQRYLDFCCDFPELQRSLPQQQIASYIGITPVALSRIRTKLKNTMG